MDVSARVLNEKPESKIHNEQEQQASAERPPQDQLRGPDLDFEADPHIRVLKELTCQLTLDNWRGTLSTLPNGLKDVMQYGEHRDGTGYWTCTPDESTRRSAIPLTLGGAPVIIPVDYQVPFRAPLQPPSDPRREAIDPSTFIQEDIIRDLFACFDDAMGFYLLLNGLLQVLVPAGFDYDRAYDQ